MPVVPVKYDAPSVASDAFVAPSSLVMGKVSVGQASSIWYNAVVRGEQGSRVPWSLSTTSKHLIVSHFC